MELLAQQLITGIATGGIYACMALAVVMIVPALALTYAVQKHLVSGLTAGAVKG